MKTSNEYYEYQFYYLIRAFLFTNNYKLYVDIIKNFDYEIHRIILITLEIFVKSNDKLHFISDRIKNLIYVFVSEILMLYSETKYYNSINSIVNEIKINLNNAPIYDEEEYLLKELSIKLGEIVPHKKFKSFEELIRTSIDSDFSCFRKIIDEEVDINSDNLFSYILCVNTYINDIDSLKDNVIFKKNVMKILDYSVSLNRKQAKCDNILHYRYKEIKKQSRKIRKKVKNGWLN